MTALETMSAFLAQGMRGRVPAATLAAAKLHVTDTVGAWIAGAQTAEGRALIAFRESSARHQDPDVATACALARLSEIDNIHLASATTPGGIVIPAALTIAAGQAAPEPAAVLEAMVAGIEAMARLGAAIGGPTVLYRGIWPTYVAAPFGVAAVAARLHDLDAAQTAQALALALTLAPPGVGHHSATTTSRWLAIGQTARNGLLAAQAAQAGFTSDVNLLDGSFFQRIYDIKPDLGAFAANLGGRFALDDTSFKPWCAARQTMAATQAVLEIIDAGVRPEAMSSIEVNVPPPYLAMIDHGVKPGDRISHLTSVSYHLALAACDPPGLFDVGRAPATLPAQVQTFMQKISAKGDESLLAHYPKAWPARVVVRTTGGTQERTVLHIPGDPQRPLDAPRLADKFCRVLAPLDAKSIDALLLRCRSAFDSAQSLTELTTQIAHICRH